MQAWTPSNSSACLGVHTVSIMPPYFSYKLASVGGGGGGGRACRAGRRRARTEAWEGVELALEQLRVEVVEGQKPLLLAVGRDEGALRGCIGRILDEGG